MSDANMKEKQRTHFTIPSSSMTDSRPNTAASATTSLMDPFASPPDSRAPSVRLQQPPSPNSSKLSFSFSDSNGPRRSILAQSAYASPAFSSALSNASSRLVAMGLQGGSNGTASPPPLSSTPTPKRVPRMKSHMLADGEEVPKPWTEKKNGRAAFSYWIVYVIIFLGIAGGAVNCYFSYTTVPLDRQPLCIVLDENFENPNTVFGAKGTFLQEVSMDGFGNGEFEMTTSSQNNSFIRNNQLYLVPTLTSDNIGAAAVLNGSIYNITDCTFNQTAPNNGFITQNGQQVFDTDSYLRACSAVSNATAGTVINPIQSARLSTMKSASIRFGRVEFKAKMPNGDWLWPAIWMLPKDSVYGAWPLSGEIDIVESRGNGLRYTNRGSNYVQGSLNWGPATLLNGVSKTYSWWSDKRKSFGSEFHTYALEWTEDFLRIYIDTRLHTLLDLKFDEPFFKRGAFPDVIYNGSSPVALQNPWINGTNATPFDQEFYLIINLAVGSTNGWFPDGQGDKPWLNQAKSPARDFINNIAQWYPTWPTKVEDRALIIDYVKMWKHC